MTFHILGIVTPTGEVIFFRGVAQPPTSIILYSINYIPLGSYIGNIPVAIDDTY